ncbi:aspartyl-tRNA synthetase [Streptococcus panodentis]|nr:MULTISPECIES: aspartyl-tRNA synthetase [Streptococcus]
MKGKSEMSELLNEFIGKKPTIHFENDFGLSGYEIIAVDGDWMKIRRLNRQGQVFTKTVRIDDIKSVELREDKEAAP